MAIFAGQKSISVMKSLPIHRIISQEQTRSRVQSTASSTRAAAATASRVQRAQRTQPQRPSLERSELNTRSRSDRVQSELNTRSEPTQPRSPHRPSPERTGLAPCPRRLGLGGRRGHLLPSLRSGLGRCMCSCALDLVAACDELAALWTRSLRVLSSPVYSVAIELAALWTWSLHVLSSLRSGLGRCMC